MSSDLEPMWVNLNPKTGEMEATTYESIHESLQNQFPLSPEWTDEALELMEIAIKYFALAYEQANQGRGELYGWLTNDAFGKAALALERVLKDKYSSRSTLGQLVTKAKKDGLLPTDEHSLQLWQMIVDIRNNIAHGDPDRPILGYATAEVMSIVVVAIYSINANGATDGH